MRRNRMVYDLSIHPTNPAEVFAAFDDGLFRSTNGGTTWAEVALPGAPAAYMRIEVCHAPSNGNVVYVFAAGSTGSGHLCGVISLAVGSLHLPHRPSKYRPGLVRLVCRGGA